MNAHPDPDPTRAPLRPGDLMLVRSFVRARLATNPHATVPASMLARVVATYDRDCATAEATVAELLTHTAVPGDR